MNALDTRKELQRLLGVKQDGDLGPKSKAQFDRLAITPGLEQWPPMSETTTSPDNGKILRGDGSFPWYAEIDGADIIVRNARATCFGGANDPQDSGATASGISTKANPEIIACSLPMNYTGANLPTRKALQGSPLPMVPWRTIVRVTGPKGILLDCPVIDLGPARSTGNALDLTIAAARKFNPAASATNFEMMCDFRIIGGARFA